MSFAVFDIVIIVFYIGITKKLNILISVRM